MFGAACFTMVLLLIIKLGGASYGYIMFAVTAAILYTLGLCSRFSSETLESLAVKVNRIRFQRQTGVAGALTSWNSQVFSTQEVEQARERFIYGHFPNRHLTPFSCPAAQFPQLVAERLATDSCEHRYQAYVSQGRVTHVYYNTDGRVRSVNLPGNVLNTARTVQADYVIDIHNHPPRVPRPPSPEDRDCANSMARDLGRAGIGLVCIIARGGSYFTYTIAPPRQAKALDALAGQIQGLCQNDAWARCRMRLGFFPRNLVAANAAPQNNFTEETNSL